MNLHEIRVGDNIIKQGLLEAFLFDCQCALFFVDMTEHYTLKPVKDIISKINFKKYPYLKIIIVVNKSDITKKEEGEGIEGFDKDNSNLNIDYIIISLKTGDNLEELLIQIYQEINSDSPEKNLLPINLVSKSIYKYNAQIKYEGEFSLILSGASTVGKTCFLKRYLENIHNDRLIGTIGIDEKILNLKIKEIYYRLTIWDTAGAERFRSLSKKYYKNVDGALIFFDVSDENSFNNVVNVMRDIKENSNRIIPIYMIGNKIDEDKEIITKEEKKRLAQKLKVRYFEISNELNLNVNEVMSRIIFEIYYRQSHIEDSRYEKILGWDIFEDEYIFQDKSKAFEKLDKYIFFIKK